MSVVVFDKKGLGDRYHLGIVQIKFRMNYYYSDE